MNISRREFVRHGAGVAVGAATIGAAGGVLGKPARKDLLPIVDTHQHLWDLSKFELPWLKPGGPLHRSFASQDYLRAVRGLNVVKSVYMEVAVDPRQQDAEAEHVIKLCERSDNPTCAAVIGGRLDSDQFAQYITRFKDSRYVKGVRHSLSKPQGCLEKTFLAGVRLLGKLGMSFDICFPPTGLLAGAKLAEFCPDTRFILDHCGNADPKAFFPPAKTKGSDRRGVASHRADQWRRDLDRLTKRPNVVCKISGIVARAPKESWTPDDLAPIINHCLDTFGPERVVFGGDWPVCTRVATFRQWVSALRDVIGSRSEADQRKLLSENAVRFYGLA